MIKKLFVGAVNMVLNALLTWGLELLVMKIKNLIYDNLIKRKFCPICGGTGKFHKTMINPDNDEKSIIVVPCPSCKAKKNRKPTAE